MHQLAKRTYPTKLFKQKTDTSPNQKKCSLGRMDRLETQLTPTIRIFKKHVEHMGSIDLNQTTYWQWFMWWKLWNRNNNCS